MNLIPYISIVIPLYNEALNLQPLYNELIKVLDENNLVYEIIFVDDGSHDKSFEIIKQLSSKDKRVNGISLSRNFGHQTAIMAGIAKANGETVITMDADLQHPPRLIPKLYAKYKQGFDIVNTRRTYHEKTGFLKKITSALFYKIINFLAEIRIEPASSDFRLMSRKVTDAFNQIQERDRFTRGLVGWMGFSQAVVSYCARSRYSGKSKYTVIKMLRFAIDGITSFSSKPLRMSLYLGLLVFLIGVIYAVFIIVSYVNGATVEGWTSTILTILFIGGFQLLSIGIVGEYIARIFNEAKGRPHYFLKDSTY